MGIPSATGRVGNRPVTGRGSAAAARAGSRGLALLSGRPREKAPIIPTVDGDEWKRHDWQNWRRRVYRPAALAAGVTGDMRPYRLRGSFVSLLLWAGEDLTYVAEQAGHSVATLARYYAGVIKELHGQPKIPAAETIREARERISCTAYVRHADSA